MKTILTILFIFSISMLFDRNEELVTISVGTGELEGSLIFPENNSDHKVALIISGSDPTDRNGNNPMMQNNSLKMLAEELGGNGIASLRYDKRGVGKSINAGVKETDLRFDHYVEYAVRWIEYLQKDDKFKEVIVIGHREGSLIGMLASQKAKVDRFISIAGVGESSNKILRTQLKAQPPLVLQQSIPILEKLEKGETTNNVPPMLNSIFRPSVQPYLISWFKYDPAIEIAKLDIPVQIIQGTTDIQVGVDQAEKLAKANPAAKKVIFEGMNHILKEAEAERMKNMQTYNQPDLPLKEGLIESIVDFIMRVE